jgi:RNA polymerase sigma factor (sigma-70 family)
MQDREVVAAIVAGDPDGIAQAYDLYAMPLYSYCRSLLREPADAADAVQDTFLIATAKLGGLRDPGKLRSWLFGVARNECYRRLRSGQATSALDEAMDMPAAAGGHASTAESVDVASAVERAELRQLVDLRAEPRRTRRHRAQPGPRARRVTNWPTRSGCPATTPTRWRPGLAASWSDPSARWWSRVPAGTPARRSTPCWPGGTDS